MTRGSRMTISWRRARVNPSRAAGLSRALLSLFVLVSLIGCGERSHQDQATVDTELPHDVVVIADGRILTRLDSLVADDRAGGSVDLGEGVERACLGGGVETGPLLAYECVGGGRRRLLVRALDADVVHAVCEDVVRLVGFSSTGEVYYIAWDSDGETMVLTRFDPVSQASFAVDDGVLDAVADAESMAVAYVKAISDSRVDPVETKMMFLARPSGEAITMDTFENAAFGDIAMVTPDAVLYVRNSGAGETHGDVRIFDTAKRDTTLVASASRVAAISPQRESAVLAACAVEGDVIVDEFGGVAAEQETIHVLRLDGSGFEQTDVPGDPIVASFLQAAFAGDSNHVVVVGNGVPGAKDSVYYLDFTDGTRTTLFETTTDSITEMLPLSADGAVVCVLADRNPGVSGFSESAMVLSIAGAGVQPVRVPGSPVGTLDIVGIAEANDGD